MTDHHQHIWTHHNGQWTCVDCPETTPTCIVNKPDDDENGHPTGIPAQNICPGCIRYEQHVLDDIADALGHWQHQPRSLVPAIRYDRDKIDGSRTQDDRPAITKPSDVLDVLWSWADMWVEARGEEPLEGAVLAHLKRYLLWAANNPSDSAWEDYRAEMRQMRHHARRLSGLLPKRLAGPCVHCGGQIVQDWATHNWQPRIDDRPEHNGLSDTHRCTGCGLTWAHREAWMYTNGHTLKLAPEFAPDTLVTIEDARKHIFPDVPASTWRTWTDRGDITEHDRNVRGQALYRVGDLHTLVQRRADTARAGRRAG